MVTEIRAAPIQVPVTFSDTDIELDVGYWGGSSATIQLPAEVVEPGRGEWDTCIRVTRPTEQPLSWIEPVLQQTGPLLRLPTNWNSYGARPVDLKTAAFALTLLAEILNSDSPPPIVVPTCEGGIQFEWHARGLDVEIEVNPPERVEVYCEDVRTGTQWEGDLDSLRAELRQAIVRLSRR